MNMMIMENQEMQESSPSLPVSPRLDRLDRLMQLQVLEEKHSVSGRRLCKNEVQNTDKQEEDKCKGLSTALDEVQHKGTLMERLAMLENRVLQLSLDMDEGNTSKSSVEGSEKLDPSSKSSTGHSEQEKEEILMLQGVQSPLSAKEQDLSKACDLKQKGHKTSRRQSKKSYKRWLGWLRMGC